MPTDAVAGGHSPPKFVLTATFIFGRFRTLQFQNRVASSGYVGRGNIRKHRCKSRG